MDQCKHAILIIPGIYLEGRNNVNFTWRRIVVAEVTQSHRLLAKVFIKPEPEFAEERIIYKRPFIYTVILRQAPHVHNGNGTQIFPIIKPWEE